MTWQPEDHGERLAQWAAQVRWNELPPAVQDKTKLHILDTLGVMYAGLDTAPAVAMQRVAQSWGGTAESTVVGRDWRLPAPSAAMVNAFNGRLPAFDDTHETMHPGTVVVSAALACAEAGGKSGVDFLAAVLAGYEVATRVSASVTPFHYNQGFHNTGTCNTFGACAAAGRILELDGPAMSQAFGLAAASAAGLRQYQRDGSMADSALNGSRAAQTGVVAAQLRAAGVPGTHGVLDGPWGFCRVLCSDPDVDKLDRDLGVRFEFMSTALKPFPTAIFTHVPIRALIALRDEHAIDASEVTGVTIATFERSSEVSNHPGVRTSTEALLSHQYCAALALSTGRVDLPDFTAERIADPQLIALAQRVSVVHEPAFDARYPATWPHRITVTMRDGRSFSVLAEQAPGAPENPLPVDLVNAKFRSLAGPVLGPAGTEALADAVARIETVKDIRQIGSLMQRVATASPGASAAGMRQL